MTSVAMAEPRPRIPAGARVVVQEGFYEGLELPIDAAWLVIGRGASADWTLSELTISRSHAAFGWDGETFFVEDLGSTNGTFVNGERRSRVPLQDGDGVQIGRLRLRVALPSRALDGDPR
ncbi:MAG: FHA domain-containing protein [Deltaproteobacteria bacterium]|nr:FHA domain-containing protein [Deltaproteobacteria bacterium]